MEEASQGEGGIFDEFNAPPIPQGVGESESEFFVDGNHSLVSVPLFVTCARNGSLGCARLPGAGKLSDSTRHVLFMPNNDG